MPNTFWVHCSSKQSGKPPVLSRPGKIPRGYGAFTSANFKDSSGIRPSAKNSRGSFIRDSVDKAWRKVSFDLTARKIIRVMDGRPPIELLLSEINFLGESRMVLIVRSGEPPKGFVIPRAVDGFEQLKQQLNEYCKVSAIENKASFIPVLPLILTIVLYAILFTAKAGLVVLIAGIVALLFQGWSIFSMRNIGAKTKSPKLVMSVFIFSWLVLLWLVYQRASSTLNSR